MFMVGNELLNIAKVWVRKGFFTAPPTTIVLRTVWLQFLKISWEGQQVLFEEELAEYYACSWCLVYYQTIITIKTIKTTRLISMIFLLYFQYFFAFR